MAAHENGFDEELLTKVLSEFAHTLAGRFDVSEVLYRLAAHVIEILGVAGTGVSVVDKDGQLRPVTGVNRLTTEAEAVEEAHQEGPCVDAFHLGAEVVVPRLADEGHKWPNWTRKANELGIEAVLSVPLKSHERSLGAMNIYNGEPRDWRESDVRVARVLCDMAAAYISNASELEQARRTGEQLQEALESRIIIEQAKGVLASQMGVSVDEAFSVLRHHARSHGATLRAVAGAVVNLGLRPDRGPQKRR
jgi:GAF domain-containing protein